ncbi:hypothetical protein EON65_22295 [archaeon]|nr:MAG: hypothetical protein EON65_22295 [archaeon]
MAYCDKSLKQGIIHDANGEPSVTELRNKLYKSFQMQYQKTLSIRKCIKILKLFISSRHMYWNMSPLSSACIEYSTSLPWSKQSLSKLMNILLFVATFDAVNQRKQESSNVVRFNMSVDVESNSNLERSGLNSPSMSHRPSISTVNVSIGDRKSSVSSPASSVRKQSIASPLQSHRPSLVSTPSVLPTAPPTTASIASLSKPSTGKRGSISSSSEQANFLSSFMTSFNQGAGMSPGGSTFAPSPSQPNKKNMATKVDLLKCLDGVIDRVWNTHTVYHVKLDERNDDEEDEDDYHMLYCIEDVVQKISALDNMEPETCYVDLDFEACQKVGSNTLINLVDFAFLMTRCWEAEHFHIKLALSKGALTVQRRAAIVGFYDPNQAVLTAAEKLCIVRLLHYYSINNEFRGVDWDEVLLAGSSGYANGKAVKFPFTLPESLLNKSHNELNFLVDKVTKMLMQQRELDELEDIKTHGRALVAAYANQQPDYTSDLYRMIEKVEFDPKTDEISVEGDSASTDSATHTPTGKDVKRHLHKKKKALSLQLTTGEMRDIMKSSSLLSPLALHKPTRAGSETLSVDQVKAYHAEVEVKMREHTQEHSHLVPANVNERVVPKRLQSPSALQIAKHNLEKNRIHIDTINKQPIGSERRDKGDKEHLGAAPHMVDIVNNDGDVLNNANVMSLSRPLSGKHLHQEHIKKHSLHYYSTKEAEEKSLEKGKTEIEEEMESFLPLSMATHPRRYNPKNMYKIHLEQGLSAEGKPILQVHVDQDRVANSTDIFEEISHADRSLQQAVDVEDSYQKHTTNQRTKRAQDAKLRILTRAAKEGALSRDQYEQLSSAVQSNVKYNAPSGGTKGSVTKAPLSLPAVLTKDTRSNSFASLSSSSSSVITPGLLLPYMYLSPYIDCDGKLTLDVNNNLYGESIVFYMDVQQCYVTADTLMHVSKTFMKPRQLEHMKILDLSYNPHLGASAAQLLSKHFSRCCHLIHLSLNNMQLGELGFKTLLHGIITGGGAEHMVRLDLQTNNISLATDGFEHFQQFKRLKALDMANNQFTLDTRLQQGRFLRGMSGLTSLTALSLAFNKIQDEGFTALVDLLLGVSCGDMWPDRTYALSVLDITSCFVTSYSEESVIALLEANTHKLTSNNVANEYMDHQAPHLSHSHSIYSTASTVSSNKSHLTIQTSQESLDSPGKGKRMSSYASASALPQTASLKISTSASSPMLSKQANTPSRLTPTRISTNTMIRTVLQSAVGVQKSITGSDDAVEVGMGEIQLKPLPLTKLYVGGNLFEPTAIKDIQSRYHLLSKCELVINDSRIHIPLVHRTYKQRKYMSEVPIVSYSQINEVKAYELREYGIVVNRDTTKLV